MSVSSSSTNTVWLNRNAFHQRPLDFSRVPRDGFCRGLGECGGRLESLTEYFSEANKLQTFDEFETLCQFIKSSLTPFGHLCHTRSESSRASAQPPFPTWCTS